MSTQTTRIHTRAELARTLAAKGYAPGAPPQLSPAALAIDKRVCRRLKCPNCDSRSIQGEPFHRGPRYRLLASCTKCQYAEEV